MSIVKKAIHVLYCVLHLLTRHAFAFFSVSFMFCITILPLILSLFALSIDIFWYLKTGDWEFSGSSLEVAELLFDTPFLLEWAGVRELLDRIPFIIISFAIFCIYFSSGETLRDIYKDVSAPAQDN